MYLYFIAGKKDWSQGPNKADSWIHIALARQKTPSKVHFKTHLLFAPPTSTQSHRPANPKAKAN
jgi:hypothetical protein